jgi:hypothetical protein
MFALPQIDAGLYSVLGSTFPNVRSTTSFFNFLVPLFFLMSFNCFVRLLPRLPDTSILPLSFLQ